MKLIVGLGNPGKEYESSRHNAGFIFVETLAKRLAEGGEQITSKNSLWKFEKKVKCDVAKFNDIILVKPQTFMNSSGEAVALLLNYYKCAVTDLVVVHDDIDLVPFKTRYKRNMGSGGHNGVKDIIEKVGSSDFFRLKIGVGRSEGVQDTKDFVLSALSDDEITFIKSLAYEFEL